MSNPRDRKALARKKAEAMERFLRDYDDYCDQARLAKAAEPDVQYILNLETDDDA